jgi:hypothetical protein
MRFLILSGLIVSLVGCVPVTTSKPIPRVAPAPRHQKVKPSESVALRIPVIHLIEAEAPRLVSWDSFGIRFEGVVFDCRNDRLVVVDQAAGPRTQFEDAEAAGQMRGGIAAVNAGFFTPEGTPLGMVVSEGKVAGKWNSASSLGSGVWCEDGSGKSSLLRRERLGRKAAITQAQLIQAGPLLIENGTVVSGLDPSKSSARTVLLWDGGTRWWIGHSTSCSLATLGQALVRTSIAGWKVHMALNLDGGRSADLWISNRIPGGPIIRRPPWNRPVRNFLVLVPR